MEQEIWKWIEWIEDYYEISNFWRVKRLQRESLGNRGYRILKEIIKKLNINTKSKEVSITFFIKEIWVIFTRGVSRLVYSHFIGKIKDNYYIIHIDWSYLNCSADNLRIDSKSNLCIKIHKEHPELVSNLGLWNSKKVVQYTLDFKKIKEFQSIKEACKEVNLLPSWIWRCINWEIKTSWGFIWRYKKI